MAGGIKPTDPFLDPMISARPDINSPLVNPAAQPESGMVLPPDATSKARTPPIGPVAHRPGADPIREYVSGEARLFVSRFVRALPIYIDDITRDFGADLYERMMLDSQVYSALHTFKMLILSNGWRLKPAIKDEKDKRYAKAEFYVNFCQQVLDNLAFQPQSKSIQGSVESFLFEMLDSAGLGHKVAEQIYRRERDWPQEDYEEADKLNISLPKTPLALDSFKVKPRATTAFVVDAWYNIIGLLGLIPGQGAPVLVGHIVADPSHLSNLLPRQKFVVMTWNPKDNNPLGRSLCRPAYDPWWSKQQCKGEYLKYLAQFATPSIWATTPENAQIIPPTDAAGNPTGGAIRTPEQILLDQVEQIMNGSAGAFPFGTQLNQLAGSGSTGRTPILDAIEFYDKQIVKSILNQTLATEEAEHMARAASQDHRSILDVGIEYGKIVCSSMMRRDVLYWIMVYNFGYKEARIYTPLFDLSATSQPNWPQTVTGVVALLSSGKLDMEQEAALFDKVGLPPRKHPEQAPQGVAGAAGTPGSAISAVPGGAMVGPTPPSPEAPEMPQEGELPEQGPWGGKDLTPGPNNVTPTGQRLPMGIHAAFSTDQDLEEAAAWIQMATGIKSRKKRRKKVLT
jgi:hypothetical protein